MDELDDTNAEYIRAVNLAGLIYKYREKELLTEQERQELDDWVNKTDAHKKLFDELLQRERVIAELEALNGYDDDKAVRKIFAAIGLLPSEAVPKWNRTLGRSIAAAVLLLLAGSAWVFFMRRNSGVQPPAIANVDASLSRDRAVLTLGDGRQVPLDSAHAGQIYRQGGVNIQQEVGRLVYTVAGNVDNGSIVYNTITVPRGAQYHVVLADSSEVWLNAASSLTFPASFKVDARHVTFAGEAYFSVAKDAARPFTVTAGKMNVQVLGTEFDVLAYGDEPAIRTTLVKGTVSATAADRQGRVQQLVLKPGEQAVLVDSFDQLRRQTVNPEEIIGWHYDEFRCHDTELPVILRQLARWYDIKIEYRGSLAGIHFNGVFSRKHPLEEVLDILADTRKVHFEVKKPATIVVIPGAKPNR